jgi:GNAT superfamily N-acetyltransferase
MNETIRNTDKKISLRTPTNEDIPALAAMAGKIFWHTFTGMMPESDLQRYIATAFTPEQFLCEWMDIGNTFIIAFYDQQWAGYAKINTRKAAERREVEKYIEVERLYLLPEYQGHGIGPLLMDYCVHYAMDHGYDTLWLNVWARNTNAIDFYLRCGFEHVDWSIRMRGNDPQKALWMKKNLLTTPRPARINPAP